MRGVKFPHPEGPRSGPAAEPQELEISASNHRVAICEKIPNDVAQGRGLPVFLCHTLDPENHLGYLALAGAMVAGVADAEHGFEASALLRRDALIGRDLVTGEMTHQPVKGGGSVQTIRVQGDEGPDRSFGRNAGFGNEMEARPDIAKQEMKLSRRPGHLGREEGSKAFRVAGPGRDALGKPQDCGVGRFTPEDRLVVRGKARTSREIATPIDARADPAKDR